MRQWPFELVVERKEEGNFVAFEARGVEFISLLKCLEDSLQKADTLDRTIYFFVATHFCWVYDCRCGFHFPEFFFSFLFFLEKTSTFSFSMH